jgi:hypothetical protein
VIFENNESINRAGFRARKMEREMDPPRKTRFILRAGALTTQKLGGLPLKPQVAFLVELLPVDFFVPGVE